MNATPPISQAQRAPDPSQNTSSAASQSAGGSGAQDFAGALSDAGAKPARRHVATKQHASAPSGNPMPAVGNQLPPTAPGPLPPALGLTTGAAGNAAGAAPVATAPATASTPAPPAAAAAALPSDPKNSPQPAAPQVPTNPLTSAETEEAAASAHSSGVVDARNLPPTPGADPSGPGLAPPNAYSIRAFTTAAPSADAAATTSAAQDGSSQAKDASVSPSSPAPATRADAVASKAAIAAATSAPISSGNASQTGQSSSAAGAATGAVAGTADADAAAQLAMAAALAQGISAPSPDSSSATDALAMPDTGVTLPGVVAAADVTPSPRVGATHAAAPTSAAVTAATAASIVRAVSAGADSGTTDKHSHDNTSDGTAGAAQLLTSNPTSDAAPGPTPTFKLAAGVDTPDFGQGVADRVSMMVDGNLTSAKLQVNPPALGPIEVRIALQGGHAQISMMSHSAVTRDALESSAPKLREMLGAQGFAQVSVDISQRSFQDRSPQPQPYEALSALGNNSPAPAPSTAAVLRNASSLLDAYA